MMTRTKKIILTIVLVLLGIVFLLPIIAFGVLRWAVLAPEKLTPLVTQEANAYLNDARLECDEVELTYFETYPYFGVKLINGRIINETDSLPCDTLVSFKRTIVAINPTYIFNSKRIAVELFFIDTPRFYGYIAPDGKANWDIVQSTDTTAQDTTQQQPLPPIDLKKVRIKSGRLVYDDRQQDLYTEVNGFYLNLKGSFANQDSENGVRLETGSSSILFDSPAYTLSNHLRMDFKSELSWTYMMREITLKDAELRVNDLPFKASGSIKRREAGQPSLVDLGFNLNILDLNEILHFIPEQYLKNRDKMAATGSILLEGKIQGEVGDSVVPSLDLCCKIDNGSYHVEGVQQGIDSLRMDVDLAFNGPCPDSSFVKVEELVVKGRNISLDVKGSAYNLFDNPAIRSKIKGNVNLTQLAKDFLNPDTIILEGEMSADLTTAFTVNDLLDSNMSKVEADGALNIERFKATSPVFGLDAYIAGLSLKAGSAKKESRYMQTDELLASNLQIDTLNIQYKENINSRISHLELRVNTARNIDTTAVIPVTTWMTIGQLRSKLPDSTWLVLKNTTLDGGIKASANNKRIPKAGFRLRMDTLKYFMVAARTGAVLSNSQFTLEALPYRDAVKQRLEQSARNRRRAAIRQASARGQRDTTAVADTSATSRLLRRWEARGKINFDKLRLFSRYFPIPMYMEGTNVEYNTNRITLKDARLHLGKSDLRLNGQLSQLRAAALRGGTLKGKLTVQSDLIDCNQLLLAMNRGARFAEADEKAPASFNTDSITALEYQNMEIGAQDTLRTDTTTQLMIIPKFLDLSLRTDANKILVNKLIDLFPSMDTLVPMLRSFEGVVDCQITATCQTDSTMSILLPTLNASCFMRGKDMVLLDGETFAEISKTLMFKNKKRNLIDSIAVDLAIKDSKIEVFPFLVEMDRYKVAVGGTHNMDMTFDYHLSVLKSPVPFKLGIDITGNLDDFKFKIVRCKYKDFLQPAKQAELDSTRRNVRELIRDEIRRQIREAAPELGNSLSENHPFHLGNDEKGLTS